MESNFSRENLIKILNNVYFFNFNEKKNITWNIYVHRDHAE